MAPREFERLMTHEGKKYLGCRRLKEKRDGPRSMWDMCEICMDPIILWRIPARDESAICEICVQALQKGMISHTGEGTYEDFRGFDVDTHGYVCRLMRNVEIEHGERGKRGTWFIHLEPENPFNDGPPYIRTIFLCCPECGNNIPLDNHHVSPQGSLLPSFVCTGHDEKGKVCGYHEFLTFKDWVASPEDIRRDQEIRERDEKEWKKLSAWREQTKQSGRRSSIMPEFVDKWFNRRVSRR